MERKARRVTILGIEILEMKLPVVKLRVACTKGTYIRTLCHDVGEKLGCGGTMKSLVRTRVGHFAIGQARTLGELQALKDAGNLEDALIPTESAFEECARLCVPVEAEKYLRNGNPILASNFASCADEAFAEGQRVRMCTADGTFLGLYEYVGAKKSFEPVKMFL